MAGKGPPPKDPKIRQRRNKAITRAILPSQPRQLTVPALPKVRPVKDWHPMAREFWIDVWRSPMREKYLTVDIHGLYTLVELVHQFWTAPTPEAHREIRLARPPYGITPVDRLRLQWEIHEVKDTAPPAPPTAPPPPPTPRPTVRGDDPRRVLTMVRKGA